jgi:DNA-binding protein YbaB
MKISALSLLMTVGAASAFAPQPPSTASLTQLQLFGGGGKKEGGEKAPGMMDQLAMFKKAQEMAQKKAKLDLELATLDFQGTVEGKVTAQFKFVPIKNPMDPNPDYEATSFEFDDAFFESASPEELSAAVKEAIDDGIKTTNEAVAKKYETMQADLMAAFGGGPEGAAPPS